MITPSHDASHSVAASPGTLRFSSRLLTVRVPDQWSGPRQMPSSSRTVAISTTAAIGRNTWCHFWCHFLRATRPNRSPLVTETEKGKTGSKYRE